MYNFSSILEKSNRKTRKKLTDDIIFSQYNSQAFYRMVKEYYNNHPDAKDEEVYDYFSELFAEMNLQIVKLPIIKNATLEYNICKYLNRHDKERKKAYDKVIGEEERKEEDIFLDNGIRLYNSNRLSASRTITIQVLKELRGHKEDFSEEDRKAYEKFFSFPKSVQSNHIKKLDSKTKRDLKEIKDLFSGDEYTQYSIFLKKCEPLLEIRLKEDYIESIETLGDCFTKLGLLGDYCKNYDNLLSRLNMKDLNYPLKESKEDTISLEDLFKKENLQKLSLNKLSMLNTFWLNRLTKEIESVNQSFFIVKNLDLLEKIKEAIPSKDGGRINIPTDKERLEGLYSKMNFLHEVTNIIFFKLKDDKDAIVEEIDEDGKTRVIKRVDAEPVLEQLEKDMGSQYTKYFSSKQPEAENSLIEDIDDYRVMENAIRNTYMAKDKNIIAILSNLYENGFSKNWGIIPDKQYPNSRMILLAIDSGEMNMPIRLHIDRTLVKDFLKGYQGNTIIPIYDGAEDFQIFSEHIKTPMLMPIYNKQKKALKELMGKNNHPRKNLIEHLNFLATGEYPEHLKIETKVKKKGKTKITKKIPQKKYMDLSTNEEFIKDGKENFVKVEPVKRNNEERTHE